EQRPVGFGAGHAAAAGERIVGGGEETQALRGARGRPRLGDAAGGGAGDAAGGRFVAPVDHRAGRHALRVGPAVGGGGEQHALVVGGVVEQGAGAGAGAADDDQTGGAALLVPRVVIGQAGDIGVAGARLAALGYPAETAV